MEYSLESPEDVQRMIDHCEYGDPSDELSALAHKCIQRAQFFNNKDLEFEARHAFLYQANFTNQKDKVIATYPWLLNEIDKGDKGYFEIRSTLWKYKWVIGSIGGFASISIEKIEALMADLEKRFLDYGTGTRLIHYLKMGIYNDIGDEDKALEYIKLYTESSEKGTLDDCQACQPNVLISDYLSLRMYDKVNTVFEPIWQKQLTCKAVPQTTYPKMAFANWVLGEKDQAKKLALLARRNLKLESMDQLWSAAYLLMYYAFEKEFVKGRKIMELQLHYTNRRQPENTLLHFYFACWMLFQSMLNEGKRQITLHTKEKTIFNANEKDVVLLKEGEKVLIEKCRELAKQLDTRNRNSTISNYYFDHLGGFV